MLTYGETSVPALALLSTVVWQMSRVNKEQLIANSVTRLFINYCTWRNTWFVCMWGINLICRNYVTRPFYQLHHLRKHMVCMHVRNKSHVCKVCDKIFLSSTIPEETHCLYEYRKETSFIKLSVTRFFINYCTWGNTWFVCMWERNIICVNYVPRLFSNYYNWRNTLLVCIWDRTLICANCD